VVQKRVLNRVNAVFEPGTLTLVLGQPGSGVSTLLKVLSGQLPMERNVAVEGDVCYNGRSMKELLPVLPQLAAYVPQSDQHFASLTVGETLRFAHACCDDQQRPHELDRLYPEVVIQQLGLQGCRNTKVGSTLSRGVSGGERRRVTVGEMEFGSKHAVCMDGISTGLDSATTFDLVSTQRDVARILHETVVMALLQPSPEVFDLFDSVLLLHHGEVLYFGLREQVLPYFERLGLLCPLDVDVADFLLDIATKQQRQYEHVRTGSVLAARAPRLGSEFAERFRQSVLCRMTTRALNAPWRSTHTLLRRHWTITLRNRKFLSVRAVMVVGGGLIYGTTFYHVDLTNVQATLGVVYQTAIFLSVGQASEVPTFMAAREVFYKQRRANFYRASSFVVAYLAAAAPVIAAECVVFGALVYWLCGLVAELGPFVIFAASLILSSAALSASFLALSAMAPHVGVAQPVSTLSNVLFSVFAGFVVPRGRIPAFLSWLYWLNPVAWCLRSVMVSQYRSSSLDVCVYEDENYCERFNQTAGAYLLSQYDVPADDVWVSSGIAYLALVVVLFVAVASYVLEYKRFDAPASTSQETRADSRRAPRKKRIDRLQLQLETRFSHATGAEYYFKVASSGVETPGVYSNAAVVDVLEAATRVEPVTLAFTNLRYTVKHKRKAVDLLKGVTGYALPGTMTALMGSSGAGKTTLMDVIAGRKAEGCVRGEIMLNGFPATDQAIRRCAGYCEQQDVHSEGSTVREALTFSAFLRQDSSVSSSSKLAAVEDCLDLLDLRPIADQIIRGRSQEQLKRLSIGVELAAQPSVLFLDEPSSGLDARAAKIIMDSVRKVANSGRTVVCTIHQPSSDIFFLFDSLLLLKRGGEMAFFGELVNAPPDQRECGHLIDYFEAIPGVPRLPSGQNPATWMLECIGAGVGGETSPHVDFVRHFQASREYRGLKRALQRRGVALPAGDHVPEVLFDTKRAASSTMQLCAVVQRFFVSYWRTPSYNLTRLVAALGLGVVFGLLLVQEDYATYQGVNAAVDVILMTTLYQGNISFNSVLPFTARERAAFYRERNAQAYNVLWYFVGSTVVEVPYALAVGLVFSAVFYPMLGFTSLPTGLLYWLNVSLFVLLETYLGQLLVYALPTLELATIAGVLFNSFFLLFSGFNPPAASIPSFYKWGYYISPPVLALGSGRSALR